MLNISCRSKNLLSIFASRERAWRVIQLLCKIKGLVRVSLDYHFGCTAGCGRSHQYAYNKATEKLVLSLVKKYGLTLRKAETIRRLDESDFDCDPELYGNVRVSSKLKISHCGELQCKKILDRKYGALVAPRLRKALAMNFSLPKEQKICFDWNVRKSKTGFITKIGARATSELVSYKSRKKENAAILNDSDYRPNPDYNGLWREDYLDDFFGGKDWFEFDIRGSIYQVTHLLNFGEWMGNGIDPYELMFGQPFSGKGERKMYKSLCMTLYFDRTTTIVNHNRIKTPLTLERYGEDRVQAMLSDAEARMRGFTGDKFDSEVFLHESMLYLDFAWELRQRGISVVQVYDGFYFKYGSVWPDELDELMRKCAMTYRLDYTTWRSEIDQSALRQTAA